METLRTPDERFEDLPGFDHAPHYTEVPDGEGGALRIHHVDTGPSDGPTVLCMHGQPTWCYLYRHMIDTLNERGVRVVAPDLVGYGRSDKPTRREDFSYNRQVDWMNAWLRQNDLSGLTFFGQDWGGLIGLRMVAENPERFDRVVVANTGLPLPEETPDDVLAKIAEFRSESTPTPTMPEMMAALSGLETGDFRLGFAHWQKWTWETEDPPVGMMVGASVAAGGTDPLGPGEVAAYDAPFPGPEYKMGARAMPSQVPTLHTDPSMEMQAAAWKVFREWKKPLLSLFTDNDPVTGAMEPVFRSQVPGAQGQPHQKIQGGGHFLQEGRGKEVATAIADWLEV